MDIQSLLTIHYCFCSVANREKDQCHYGIARWLPVGKPKEKCRNNKYGCGCLTKSNMHTKPDLQYQFAKCHDCQVHNKHNTCIYNMYKYTMLMVDMVNSYPRQTQPKVCVLAIWVSLSLHPVIGLGLFIVRLWVSYSSSLPLMFYY